jgi:hypothetical protein
MVILRLAGETNRHRSSAVPEEEAEESGLKPGWLVLVLALESRDGAKQRRRSQTILRGPWA